MRFSDPDAAMLPLIVPVAIFGLWPLAFLLPLTGFLGVAIIGILLGTGAIMAQMEEQADHARQVVGHGFAPRAEQAGYQLELSTLMRSLRTTKLVSAGLVVVGFGGFLLFQ
jgi:hypothetical protein